MLFWLLKRATYNSYLLAHCCFGVFYLSLLLLLLLSQEPQDRLKEKLQVYCTKGSRVTGWLLRIRLKSIA